MYSHLAMRLDADNNVAEIRRRFDATPAIVFAAFADPLLVRRWLRPGPEVGLDVLAYDFRPGGAYRFAYQNPGAGVMHVSGVFELIEPPSRIVFSWNIEPPDEHAGVRSEVRVSIRQDDAGSEVIVQHAKLARPGASARHRDGWRGALEGLAEVLAASGRTPSRA
jgi:uncharacterized protein YndB with AHSA1/START domain